MRTDRVGIGRVFFSTDAALREEPGRGGDDEGSAGTSERGAERLDRELVGFAGSGDVREVMNEGRVDDAIRASRSTSQALGILERPSMHFGAGSGKRLGGRIRASQAEHLMARADEFLNDRSSDEACGSCDEHTHGLIPSFDEPRCGGSHP